MQVILGGRTHKKPVRNQGEQDGSWGRGSQTKMSFQKSSLSLTPQGALESDGTVQLVKLVGQGSTPEIAYQPREGHLAGPTIGPATGICGHRLNTEHLPRQLVSLSVCYFFLLTKNIKHFLYVRAKGYLF